MSVMLSKRANVFYLEHVRVIQQDGRVVYLQEEGVDSSSFFNIPEKNTALLLLGKGSSITDAAARKLAESNVMLGFCGSGGSPLFSTVDHVFMSTQSEYRPTEYMQGWMRMWLDEPERLASAKALLRQRCALIEHFWGKDAALAGKITAPAEVVQGFRASIETCTSTEELLAAEGRFAKRLYALLSDAFKLKFVREEGKRSNASRVDTINGFLDHGNYIAYGYAAVALNGLGISFALPLLHGKTRRGALVFDVADLLKDALVMPTAFAHGTDGSSSREFRQVLIARMQDVQALDILFDFVKKLSQKDL
ncbi:MAG: type I-F CRISPR-associated endonuclease Cas1f [Pseudomonas sp.]|nr:type I-F CRISPR-associated endonuclease Cas1f [Pseudomonas sp.]